MSALSDSGRLATFERGDPLEVPFEKVEAELAGLWRRVAKADDTKRAVTRACLWNVIVTAEPAMFATAKTLIDQVSAKIPARVIALQAKEAAGAAAVRAWIEVNWQEQGGNKRAIGSDEVTLEASGAAVERLPSLVRSLLVPDAPSAILAVGPIPAALDPVRDLLPEVDRLIVDTRRVTREGALLDLATIGRDFPLLEVADLSWLGIAPLRGLCASLFDPPRDPSVLERLDRVRVASGVSGTQARGLLALGWLAAQLGWTDVRGGASERGSRRWRATGRAGSEVQVELETRLGGATHGVVAIELRAGDLAWMLERDQRNIDVRGPDLPPRIQPARSHSDAELAVAALGVRGRDPIYQPALEEASRMVGDDGQRS